jgi:hypothetical protein
MLCIESPVAQTHACDGRDFDLWVQVLDIAPDGAAINLMSPGFDVERASYRELSRGKQLLLPGKICELGWRD